MAICIACVSCSVTVIIIIIITIANPSYAGHHLRSRLYLISTLQPVSSSCFFAASASSCTHVIKHQEQ